jgi:hypothetical protein
MSGKGRHRARGHAMHGPDTIDKQYESIRPILNGLDGFDVTIVDLSHLKSARLSFKPGNLQIATG